MHAGRYAQTVEICRPLAEVFAFVNEPGNYPFRGTFDLEPAGAGTRLTWVVEVSGLATRLGGPLVGRAVQRELRANTERLKALLERDRSSIAIRRTP